MLEDTARLDLPHIVALPQSHSWLIKVNILRSPQRQIAQILMDVFRFTFVRRWSELGEDEAPRRREHPQGGKSISEPPWE